MGSWRSYLVLPGILVAVIYLIHLHGLIDANLRFHNVPPPPPQPPLSSPPFLLPNTTRYVLIHVGKTAGSKIGCELLCNPSKLCDDETPLAAAARRARRDGSALARASVFVAHKKRHRRGKKECPGDLWDFDSFLFTTRHPLERMLSWFYYERGFLPKKEKNTLGGKGCVYPCVCELHAHGDFEGEGCFRDAEEFAVASGGSHDERNGTSMDCQRLAYDVARGKQACYAHNHYNYEYYLRLARKYETTFGRQRGGTRRKTEPRYPVLVLRQEHLSKDWDKLETAFGGGERTEGEETERFRTVINRGDGGNGESVSSSSSSWRSLSVEGRTNLCSALCRDIQAYKLILYRAVNLDRMEVRRSIGEVVKACPAETYELRDCGKGYDMDWPDIFGNMTKDW